MSVAATLDKLVQLQALALGQDEYGAPSNIWADVGAPIWASIKDLSGREFVNAGGVQNSVTTKIGIRYRAGVVAAMRVMHGAATYNIEAVLGQDGRMLLLMCSRGVNLG